MDLRPPTPDTGVTTSDHGIAHPAGRLFARQWQPADADPARAPIVLLHDSLGAVELWRTFPALLAAASQRRVFAYDRRGFGRSDARTDRVGVDFIAQEARDELPVVLDALGIDRFVALGHSVGGAMAIEAAAAMPERCDAMVTIAAQTYAEDVTLNGIRAAKLQFEDPAQVERLARYHGPKTPWVLDAWIGTWLSPTFADWTLAQVLPRVRCPALAIHGEDDAYGSPVHARLIRELAGGEARAEVIAGAGHVLHREMPERVVALVTEFLAPGRLRSLSTRFPP